MTIPESVVILYQSVWFWQKNHWKLNQILFFMLKSEICNVNNIILSILIQGMRQKISNDLANRCFLIGYFNLEDKFSNMRNFVVHIFKIRTRFYEKLVNYWLDINLMRRAINRHCWMCLAYQTCPACCIQEGVLNFFDEACTFAFLLYAAVFEV